MVRVKTKHTTHDDKQYPFVDDLSPRKNPKIHHKPVRVSLWRPWLCD